MRKIKILIIDDEVDFCAIMKSYLQKTGYEVYLAYNIQDGLKLISEKSPDILFIDNNLPDGHGWELADEIIKNNPSIKLNLISAFKQNTSAFLSVPNVKIWEKPISLASLQELFSPHV
ncbi:MAG: response regulator [Chitinophagaceae bacterium]